MPDLGNLLNTSSLTLTRCPNLKPCPTEQCESSTPLYCNSVKPDPCESDWKQRLRFPILPKRNIAGRNGVGALRRSRNKKSSDTKTLDYYVKAWVAKKIELGVPERKCFLPFLVRAPKLAECRFCQNLIYPGEEVLCSVHACQCAYHLKCAKDRLGFQSSRKFKCPQHACYLCKNNVHLWRCSICHLASHDKCAAFPEYVHWFNDQPRQAICWKHFTDWPLEKHAVPTNDIEEIFHRLPLPYVEEEFKIDLTWRDIAANKLEPPPYVHIRRNVYLVKKKRDGVNSDTGCTSCSSNTCSEDCVCRVQCISCSKACRCSDACKNRPFRKDKKIKIVLTEFCGWGVEAAESIGQGEFIIEYIGEVISDAVCTQRLWDMKYRGIKNFYMCEIRKDFTIDATFKGNSSRFLNHSCNPNCNLEKWQVEGETRVGVFAARSIEVGEQLTYDYRFVQFGPEVKCQCGAANCQGYLGTKRKVAKEKIGWGSKRQRTRSACLAILKL